MKYCSFKIGQLKYCQLKIRRLKYCQFTIRKLKYYHLQFGNWKIFNLNNYQFEKLSIWKTVNLKICQIRRLSIKKIYEKFKNYQLKNFAGLPKGNLTIRVEKPRYAVGDTVRGNCTAPAGNPPANVTWTVNGLPVGLYKFYKVL